jgi:hypothetical protein
LSIAECDIGVAHIAIIDVDLDSIDTAALRGLIDGSELIRRIAREEI